MSKEKQSRFQLQPSVIAAIDKVRGRQPRQQFVEDAVLYKLAWHGQTPQLERRSCRRCGKSLPSDHASMVYCSGACRTAAFQARKTAIEARREAARAGRPFIPANPSARVLGPSGADFGSKSDE